MSQQSELLSGADAIKRGTVRSLTRSGLACLVEVPLPNHRRADIIAFDRHGHCSIIEVKSGPADFKSDQKWHNYADFCDEFYFAVDLHFPTEILPPDTGLIVADAYRAEIIRTGPSHKMAAARRAALMRKLARLAAFRLTQQTDPSLENGIIMQDGKI